MRPEVDKKQIKRVPKEFDALFMAHKALAKAKSKVRKMRARFEMTHGVAI